MDAGRSGSADRSDPRCRASDHALRRPRRRQRSVLRRRARRDHRADRPERRRQDHRLQLHHRLLQADAGHARCCSRRAARHSCWSACRTIRIAAKAKVARTFQNIRLFAGMTVLENLLVAQHNPLMLASGMTFFGAARPAELPRAEQRGDREGARTGSSEIGLVDRADDPAGDLPYGAQRRLEIARAMCTEPELLCLDEPAAGLNPRESAELNRAASAHPRPLSERRCC